MASDWSFRGIGGGGKGLPPPLGFSDHHVQPDAVFQSKDTKKGQEVAAILQKKAWEKVAFQPLFMTAFMLWMSGKNITIFSIITVAMACMRPVQALLSMNKTWAPFDKDVDILLPKLAWAGIQLLGVALGLYRLGTMGLLPLTSADWISLLAVKQAAETSVAGGPVGL